MTKLQKGDILSCTGTGFLSKGIQLFSRSRINHTAMVVEIWGKLFIIDSQKDGTNPRPLQEWINKYNYEYVVHRPKHRAFDLKEISARAMSKVGHTPYDFKSLLWYQPRYMISGKWRGKTGGDAEKRMYCSEFVAWVYNFPGWYKLSPQDVFEFLLIDNRFYIAK